MSINDFCEKRKAVCVENGKLYCREFYKKYNRVPKPSEMSAFFPLFLNRNEEAIKAYNIWIGWNGDSKEEILQSFLNSDPVYDSYDDFVYDAIKDLQNNA